MLSLLQLQSPGDCVISSAIYNSRLYIRVGFFPE